MKKLLALILALAMVFCLAACGSSSSDDTGDAAAEESSSAAQEQEAEEPEAAAEPEETEEPAAAEEVSDGTVDLTGMKAAIIVPLSTVEALQTICSNFVTYMEEYGATAVSASMEADTATCISLLENYVADDYDLVVIIPLDETGLEDAVTSARASGTMVVMLSTVPTYEVDGGLTTDYESCGYAVSQMGVYWLEQTFADAEAGSISAAVVASETPENYKLCKQAIINTLKDCELIDNVYTSGEEVGGSMDAGFNFAEEAMTANPNTRLFVCNEPDSAKGINNYLLSRSDLNLDEFCVVAINTDETAVQMVEESTDSTQSVLRGLIPYGSDDTGRTAADIAYALLSGTGETPYWLYDEMFTMNTFGWTIDMVELP